MAGAPCEASQAAPGDPRPRLTPRLTAKGAKNTVICGTIGTQPVFSAWALYIFLAVSTRFWLNFFAHLEIGGRSQPPSACVFSPLRAWEWSVFFRVFFALLPCGCFFLFFPRFRVFLWACCVFFGAWLGSKDSLEKPSEAPTQAADEVGTPAATASSSSLAPSSDDATGCARYAEPRSSSVAAAE